MKFNNNNKNSVTGSQKENEYEARVEILESGSEKIKSDLSEGCFSELHGAKIMLRGSGQ